MCLSKACRLASSKRQTGSNAGAQSHRADNYEDTGDTPVPPVVGGSLVAERVDYDLSVSGERDCL